MREWSHVRAKLSSGFGYDIEIALLDRKNFAIPGRLDGQGFLLAGKSFIGIIMRIQFPAIAESADPLYYIVRVAIPHWDGSVWLSLADALRTAHHNNA
jgi:hypothetical protein